MNDYNKLTYKELIEKQNSYLDKIDFKPYIDNYKNLKDLWIAVEDDYDDTELTNNDFLDGSIFCWIDHFELSEYLKDKYNVNYREYTYIEYLRN